MEKVSILKLTGKDKDSAIKKLTENGKKELIELSPTFAGKTYRAIILVDFKELRKAMQALINTDISGTKGNQNVNVSIDEIGAGDKLLFNCWYEGDEEIRSKMALRVKATKTLGSWVQEYMNEESEETEKKS